jgi:hypothetical protein
MKPLTDRELARFDETATGLILRSVREMSLMSDPALIDVGFAEITKLLLAEVRRLRSANELLRQRVAELESERGRIAPPGR